MGRREGRSIVGRESGLQSVMMATDMGRFEEMKAKNHFERLGLQRTSEIAAVKMAYLQAAKRYHPDTFSNDMSPDALKERSDIFGLIVEAQSVLSDPARRADYIAGLDNGGNEKVDLQKIHAAEDAFRKGKIQMQARNYVAALKLFTEAVTLYPEDAEPLAWLGYSKYLSTPNKAEGLKDINKALVMNPVIAPAYYFLGFIFKAQGDKAKALVNFNKCLKLDPKHIDAMREVRMAR